MSSLLQRVESCGLSRSCCRRQPESLSIPRVGRQRRAAFQKVILCWGFCDSVRQRSSFRSCEFPESSERGESVDSFYLTEQSPKSCCSRENSAQRAELVEQETPSIQTGFYRSEQGKTLSLYSWNWCAVLLRYYSPATVGQHEAKVKYQSGSLVAGCSTAV